MTHPAMQAYMSKQGQSIKFHGDAGLMYSTFLEVAYYYY